MAIGDRFESISYPSSPLTHNLSDSSGAATSFPSGLTSKVVSNTRSENLSSDLSLKSYLSSHASSQSTAAAAAALPLASASVPKETSPIPASNGSLQFCREIPDVAATAVSSSLETNELLRTKPAQEVINMGFPAEVVRDVIHLKAVETNSDYATVEALLDAVIAYQIATEDTVESDEPVRRQGARQLIRSSTIKHRQLTEDSSETEPQVQARGLHRQKKPFVKLKSKKRDSTTGNQFCMERKTNESEGLVTDGTDLIETETLRWSPHQKKSMSPVPLTLMEENQKMKSSRKCKICLENDVRIVFLPCGHMISCDECCLLIETCTACNQPVKGSVKVFLA